MIKKIVLALILGVATAMLIFERDPWVQARIGNAFKDYFSTTYQCSMTAEVEDVTLLHPSLVLRDVAVTGRADAAWQWRAARFTVGFSWWQLLMYGIASLYVHMVDMHTDIPSFADATRLKEHLMLMTTAGNTGVPSRMDEVKVTKLDMHMRDDASAYDSVMCARFAMRRISGKIRSQVTLLDGTIAMHNTRLIERMRGSCQMDLFYTGDVAEHKAQGDCSFVLSQLPAEQRNCFMRGTWHNGKGSAEIFNEDRSLSVQPLLCTYAWPQITLDAQVRTGCAQLAALMGYGDAHHLHGDVALQLHAEVNKGAYEAQFSAHGDACSYGQHALAASWDVAGAKKGDEIVGTVSVVRNPEAIGEGTWKYSLAQAAGSLHLHNKTDWMVPYTLLWHVPPEAGSLDITYQAPGLITGHYACELQQLYTKATTMLVGAGHIDATAAHVEGVCGSLMYQADFAAEPTWHVRSMRCGAGKGDPLCTVTPHQDPTTGFKVAVQIPFIRSLIAALYNHDVQGAGVVTVDVHHGATTRAEIQLHQGTIRVPHMYNVIDKVRAVVEYDPATHTIKAPHVVCSLHRGALEIHDAVAHVTPAGDLVDWYIPLSLRSCLLNFKQNFFTSVSGQVTASHIIGAAPLITGSLFLDRSQIKENVFSDQFQQRIARFAEDMLIPTSMTAAMPDIACDLSIETVAPLQVRTPFLEVDAHLGVKLSHTAHDPQVSGELTILSGSLLFPYRPLHITKGSITFSPQQPHNPLIELVAQNQVRNYAVSMHVTGSLLEHHIMFESAPPLTEEQIIALLLVGSENESLNIVMPTLLMQNLASLVFGDDTTVSGFERYLKRLMKPLKGINIVPRFSDQSSRGGIRGAIDIEVNDRWRALIQKNFSLSEDTRFEAEYQASDDIRLRAVRDEHRDMGAEIEMRWKF